MAARKTNPIKKQSDRMVIAPQAGLQESAMKADADVIIYGGSAGSGKSHLLLMKILPFVHDPNFNAIFFRRVTKQLIGAGGLWQESEKMYQPFLRGSRTKPELLRTFKSGATVAFNHLEHDKNRFDHQGLQYSMIAFDELTHFSQEQFTYLLSRLRSDAESKSFCFATCNPDPSSWVLDWVKWWLDDDGFPIKERNGAKRYYVLVEDVPIMADTPEFLKENFPDLCKVWNPNDEVWVEIEPKSIQCFFGTIFDNPALIKKNPKYLAELKSLPSIERARLLDGNWFIQPEGSSYFKRHWLKKVDTVPLGGISARAWDKAASEPSEVERYPDFTACVKMVKDKDGFYTIVGDFVESNKDSILHQYGRFRKRAGERNNIMLAQAAHDGQDCVVVMPQDPSAAGKFEFEESCKMFVESGFIVKRDIGGSSKSKLNRFLPFAAACENGIVRICESSFGSKETLEAFYRELELFSGERSSRQRKDDWSDATATAFNYLTTEKAIPKFSLPPINNPTKVRSVMKG